MGMFGGGAPKPRRSAASRRRSGRSTTRRVRKGRPGSGRNRSPRVPRPGATDAIEPPGAALEPKPATLCCVLCRGERAPDTRELDAAVLRAFPDATVDGNKDDTVHSYSWGGMMLFVSHMPAPIPNDEALDALRDNPYWPDGEAIVAAHRSHLLVTVMQAPDKKVGVATAIRLASAALETGVGCGVYWGNGVVNSAEIFRDLAGGCTPDHLPLHLCIRFQPVRTADGNGLVTLGMEQFGLMEIECADTPMEAAELVSFVVNIAHYLVQQGPVIQDGNTVGGSEDQRILVRHAPSLREGMGKVYRLEFE